MKLNSIQILRAIAALVVVVYHIRAIEALTIAQSGLVSPATGLAEPGLVSGLWANGFIGVDLFFVISGFIMVYVTRDTGTGLRQARSFLFARIGRIYPVWWLFASVIAIYFTIAYGAPVDIKQAAASQQQPISHLLKSYLLVPQPVFPVLGVGWTLVHEMYFYIVFAGALLLPKRWLPFVLAAWALVLIAGTFGGLHRGFAVDYTALVFYPMTLEFILGAFAGLLICSGRLWGGRMLLFVGALWLVAAMQFVAPPVGEDLAWIEFMLRWGRVLVYGVPSVIIVYALACLEKQDRLNACLTALGLAAGFVFGCMVAGGADLVWRVVSSCLGAAFAAAMVTVWMRRQTVKSHSLLLALAAVGNWSYSLYLSHTLVLTGMRRILPFLGNVGENRLGLPGPLMDVLRLGSPGYLDNWVFVILSLSATLVVSWLAYRFFERPVARKFGGWRRRLFA